MQYKWFREDTRSSVQSTVGILHPSSYNRSALSKVTSSASSKCDMHAGVAFADDFRVVVAVIVQNMPKPRNWFFVAPLDSPETHSRGDLCRWPWGRGGYVGGVGSWMKVAICCIICPEGFRIFGGVWMQNGRPTADERHCRRLRNTDTKLDGVDILIRSMIMWSHRSIWWKKPKHPLTN